MKRYFDSCATTQADEDVISEMIAVLGEEFYNPSSPYSASSEIRVKILHARQSLADVLMCSKEEIIFTSGGTEANNTAILGGLTAIKGKIVTSRTEHASVFNCMGELQKRGFEVVFAPLNPDGSVKAEGFGELIDENTVMVALMHVNNETGAVSDIKTLCKSTKIKNPACVFVCDGVQAFCKLPVNVIDLNVDFYTMSAHKIHAPKGIGALYVKKGSRLAPLLFGGEQEKNLRPGTENVPAICGFGKAVQIASSLMKENTVRFIECKKIVTDYLDVHVENYFRISQNSAPHMLVLAFDGVKSQILLNLMEEKGFFIGSGSACSTKSAHSRVGQAINLPSGYLDGIARICFSKYNSCEDVIELAKELANSVTEVRELVHKI